MIHNPILQSIQDYINVHPDLFEQVALDIDQILDESMVIYDTELEKIKEDIINTPDILDEPEQEMMRRVEELQERIKSETLEKFSLLLDHFSPEK